MPHGLGPALADLMGEIGAKPVDPETDAFVAYVDAALVEKIFDIPKRQRKSDVHQPGELDDFGRGFEVAERVLCRFPRLNAWIGRLKVGSFDNTPEITP